MRFARRSRYSIHWSMGKGRYMISHSDIHFPWRDFVLWWPWISRLQSSGSHHFWPRRSSRSVRDFIRSISFLRSRFHSDHSICVLWGQSSRRELTLICISVLFRHRCISVESGEISEVMWNRRRSQLSQLELDWFSSPFQRSSIRKCSSKMAMLDSYPFGHWEIVRVSSHLFVNHHETLSGRISFSCHFVSFHLIRYDSVLLRSMEASRSLGGWRHLWIVCQMHWQARRQW